MKKILQSISLLLLLIAISSNLLAQIYSRSTGGSWDNAAQWTPSNRGVPNGDGVQVILNSAATKFADLDLGNKSYNITTLNVRDKANHWRLFNGKLAFHKAGNDLAEINYGGEENLILETDLDLQSDTKLDVSGERADVDFGGRISGPGKLLKFGPGALLIEQPSNASIEIYQGIIGIGKQYEQKGESDLIIAKAKDSEVRFFALDDNINITKLKLLEGTTLNLVDNPYPTEPTHGIMLKDLYGSESSTINQLSHGALIFEGTDRFYGTIRSQPGAGPIILNGSTNGNIEINGSTIEGTGRGGDLTATSGAIISPGYNGSFGTLSFRNVNLDSNTILNFKFHNVKENLTIGGMLRELEESKSVDPEKEKYLAQVERIKVDINAASRDLIRVDGNLTLAGNLNINVGATSRLEDGAYPLFKYGGKLKGNNLVISSVPPRYDASNFAVITEMPGQILLGVGPPGTVRLWKGDHTKSGSSTIHGGEGTWSDAGLNFTDPTGTQSETGGGNTAVDVFGGNPGEVGVQGPVHVHEMQILADNYTFHPLNNDSQFLTNGPITIEVDSTYQVNISVPFTGDQTGTIIKDGDGILILSGDNRNVGSFVLNGGTVVADTLNALPNSVTLKDGLMRFGMTHILQVGSYTQHEDTILALRASRTNHDLLVVNGPANLGGTLLLLQEGKGKSSSPGRQVTLITTQGLNGSRFDNIQLAHTSLEKLSVNYDANNVYVISHFDPIYPYAISRNAQPLARNLDLFSNTGRNQDLFDSLADLSLPQVPAALEKLVPGQVFALSSIGLSVSRSHMHSLQGRLDDLNSGYASYGEFNISPSQQYGLSLAGVSAQTNFLMNKDQDLWNFYLRGNGGFGRQSQDIEIPGYDYGQGGTFIGADYHLDDKVYVGGAASYTYTDASFHDDRGSLSTNSYFGHLYAAYAQPKGFNLISSLSLGDHEFDLRRRALTDTARSQPQSREVDFQNQASYNIPLKPNLRISPYAGLAYSALWMNGFQEYNSEANLRISDDQTNSLRSAVGAKAQYEKSFTKGIRKASVEMNLAWEHEYFNTQSRGIDAEWVSGRVPSFRVQGGRVAPDTLISDVNLRLTVTSLLSIITGYDIVANPDYVSHGFSVGVDLTF